MFPIRGHQPHLETLTSDVDAFQQKCTQKRKNLVLLVGEGQRVVSHWVRPH